MTTASPVVQGLEAFEIVFGKDQPEYHPLVALVGEAPARNVVSRWTFTDEERELIAAGADIYTSQMTFGDFFQPLAVFVGIKDQDAEVFRQAYGIGAIIPEKNIQKVLDTLL